jgi:nicotinamidase-related amidase
MNIKELPIPSHYDREKVGQIWKVDYEKMAEDAEKWQKNYDLKPSAGDQKKILLLLVDVQNTFCTPGFELFVAGRSGTAAVEDNERLCDFIYRNLHQLTKICFTMDTHQAVQIFHSIFLVDDHGKHPKPFTVVTEKDIEKGIWKFNKNISSVLGIDSSYGQEYLRHYTQELALSGKYELTVWPYHAMLGGIGHAVVSSVEEAVFFHGIARSSQPDFDIKGKNPFTENYSVFSPEVNSDPFGKKIGEKNQALTDKLLKHDMIIVAGQAKSHCVAWTLDDLLSDIHDRYDPEFSKKIYLLEDCTSPVVIPDIIDYTEKADEAFKKFANAGVHIVHSVDSMSSWLDLPADFH